MRLSNPRVVFSGAAVFVIPILMMSLPARAGMFDSMMLSRKSMWCAAAIANSSSYLGTMGARKEDAISAVAELVAFRNYKLKQAGERGTQAGLPTVFHQPYGSKSQLKAVGQRLNSMDETLSFLRGERHRNSNAPRPLRALSVQIQGSDDIKIFLSEIRRLQVSVADDMDFQHLYTYAENPSEGGKDIGSRMLRLLEKVGVDPLRLADKILGMGPKTMEIPTGLIGMFATMSFFYSDIPMLKESFEAGGFSNPLSGAYDVFLTWFHFNLGVAYLDHLRLIDPFLSTRLASLMEHDLELGTDPRDFFYWGDGTWVDPQVFPNPGGIPNDPQMVPTLQHAADFHRHMHYGNGFIAPSRTARLLTQKDAWNADENQRTKVTWDLLIKRTSPEDSRPLMTLVMQDWGDNPTFMKKREPIARAFMDFVKSFSTERGMTASPVRQ